MNKELLAMFRKLFALDIKALPDSISPEDFGKLIEKSAGNLFIKPEDFKNLQKTLSAKDLDLKKLQDELENATKKKSSELTESEKMISELQTSIKQMSDTIQSMKSEQDTKSLTEKYPDILPELLIGKNPDEIEKIVDRQREVNKRLYGDSRHFAKPDYSTEADIEKRKSEIKSDDSISGETAAIEIMKLERAKSTLAT